MAPAAWRAGGVVFSHLVSAAAMLGMMAWADESPRPAIYGLFISYLYRLGTLYLLCLLYAAGPGRGRNLARLLTRPPHPQRPSYQVTVGEGPAAAPGGMGAYAIVIAVLAFFSFILINLKDQELVTSAVDFVQELRWGFALAFIWWLLDLADRRITLRFEQSLPQNLGYNSTETTVIALTVLTGGLASAAYGSPWPYFLVLIGLKTLYDAWDEVKFPRGEHPQAPNA